jgi:hypothetical protein
VIGLPCSVRDVGGGNLATTSASPVVDEIIEPQTILEVHKFEIIGDVDWLIAAIEAEMVLTLADGSYMKELFTDANLCAFVLECQEGRGRILGWTLEVSIDSCAY